MLIALTNIITQAACIFMQNSFEHLLSACLQFGYVIFGGKRKSTQKLVKLTKGVNFPNILQATFSFKSVFAQFLCAYNFGL